MSTEGKGILILHLKTYVTIFKIFKKQRKVYDRQTAQEFIISDIQQFCRGQASSRRSAARKRRRVASLALLRASVRYNL